MMILNHSYPFIADQGDLSSFHMPKRGRLTFSKFIILVVKGQKKKGGKIKRANLQKYNEAARKMVSVVQ